MARLSRWFNLNWRRQEERNRSRFDTKFIIFITSLSHVPPYPCTLIPSSSFFISSHSFNILGISLTFITKQQFLMSFCFSLDFFYKSNAAWCSRERENDEEHAVPNVDTQFWLNYFTISSIVKLKWWNKYLSRSRHTHGMKNDFYFDWFLPDVSSCLSFHLFLLTIYLFDWFHISLFLLFSKSILHRHNFFLLLVSSRTYQLLSIGSFWAELLIEVYHLQYFR